MADQDGEVNDVRARVREPNRPSAPPGVETRSLQALLDLKPRRPVEVQPSLMT